MPFFKITEITLLWKSMFWLLALLTSWLSLVPVDFIPSAFNFWDKAQHALGFAALAFTGLAGYPRHRARVISGLLALGGGIEYAQDFTGWRHGDWVDWLADGIGIVAGSVVRLWTQSKIRIST